jgi:transcriptional repressor NrdR
MLEGGEREIDSSRIGEYVMDALRSLDQVAYVRFASVYRSFEDVRAFLEEIERLENDLPPGAREQQLALIPSEPDSRKR